MYTYKKLTLILLNSLSLNLYSCGEVAPNMPQIPMTSLQAVQQNFVNPQNPPEQEFELNLVGIQDAQSQEPALSSGLNLLKGGSIT